MGGNGCFRLQYSRVSGQNIPWIQRRATFRTREVLQKAKSLCRNKQLLDKEGEGNAAFRVGEVYQLAGFEGTLMAGYEGGSLAAYKSRQT